MKLPRPYISFSQLRAFEEGNFVARYIEQKPMYETDALRLGKKFSEALEGKEVDDERIMNYANSLKMLLPEGGESEAEISCSYSYNGKKYVLYGKVDYLVDEFIYEMKTGSKTWTQSNARLHGQVLFYQLMIYLSSPDLKEVDGGYIWLPTKDGFFTGEVKTFTVPFDMNNLIDIKRRLNRFIDWIESYGE